LHHDDGAHHYFLTKCSTCREALLYKQIDPTNGLPHITHGQFELATLQLVWPPQNVLHECVPTTVRRCYEEAAAIMTRAPNAFANQVRRALEALCKDRGAKQRMLAQNLQELAKRGEIPPTLAELTDVVRMIGNIGSHAADEEVAPEYVPVIDDFFRAVVEYVYVAPWKVREFKARLSAVRSAVPTTPPAAPPADTQ
jgi:hypothetical protein